MRARPAGSADGAANDEFAPLDDAPGLLNARSDVIADRKDTVHRQSIGAASHQRRVRPGPQQELQARQNHRLACTRFTRHHDQAAAKIDVR